MALCHPGYASYPGCESITCIRRDLEPVCGQEFFFQYAILGDRNTARWRTDNTIFSECSEGFSRYIFEFRGDAGAGGPKLTQCVSVKVIGS